VLTSDSASNWPSPSLASRKIAGTRLAVGVLQGLVLYLLFRAFQDRVWPATEPLLFAPLAVMWLMAPVIFSASLGVLDRRQLLIWIALAAAIMVALGVYDVWRTLGSAATPALGAARGKAIYPPSEQLLGFSVAGFFIGQSLIMTSVREQRRIASYAGYFETAWKQFVQLAFSALFVAVIWMVLWLGAELFLLVKLDFFRRLLAESWFVIPVIAFAFACAMHITDVRPAIVRGIRTLLLVLMSWILPVAVLVIGGFLASLPFTGLEPLWATRRATTVLLGAAAVLIVLINAAYQDGAPETAVARLVRGSARLAAILLTPITVIAIYALALRVGDYGWTSSRIVAAACLLIASCYAAGYARATLRPGWLASVAKTNIATAFVVLAVLILLFSPLADPARLSVWHQVSRLESGKVAADKFDFGYLRFRGQRYGKAALAELYANAKGKDGQVVRDRIVAARKMEMYEPPEDLISPEAARIDISANARVWPKGSQLPPSFLQTQWNARRHRSLTYPECMRAGGRPCDFVLIDLTADGKPEIIIIGTGAATVMGENETGQWDSVGMLPLNFVGCESLRKSLIDGDFKLVPPRMSDLQIAGTRITIDGRGIPKVLDCKDQPR
jgi:hypothetical protein